MAPERAAKLRKTMFAGYEQVDLIDTQAYDVDECLDQSRDVADELELEHGIVQGSVQLLERLFKGERDSEIVVVPPDGDHRLQPPVRPRAKDQTSERRRHSSGDSSNQRDP